MAAFCVACLVLAQSAPAIDYVSAADGSWGTTTTWDPTGVPVAGDNVQINHVVTLDGERAAEDVMIGAGGDLQMGAETLSVFRDFTVSGGGVLTKGTSTLRFTGSGPQVVAGALDLHHLTIANMAASPDDTNAVVALDPVHCTGQLTVSDGQFMPADGSSFRNIYINTHGILKPASGAETIVSGDLDGTGFETFGSFVHNGGKLTFSGSGSQNIELRSFTPTTFNDVEVKNTAPAPDEQNHVFLTSGNYELVGTLSILDGMFTFEGTVHHVHIGADGILNFAIPGAAHTVTGNWSTAPGATLLQGPYPIWFGGNGRQEISGGITFGRLFIDNTAASPDDVNAVVALDPIHSSLGLYVQDGQFMPAGGSSFMGISIRPGGILKPAFGAETFVTGTFNGTAFSSLGSFIHNGGKITFSGSRAQPIDSSSLTVFNDLEVRSSDPISVPSSGVFFGNFHGRVDGTFSVLMGSAGIQGFIHDLLVAPGCALYSISSVWISGDWTLSPGATFADRSYSVTFDGTGPQAISGETTFSNLTIANTAPSPDDINAVVGLDPVHVTARVTVEDGQFVPASGSSFGNIFVRPDGILKPEELGTIDVSGGSLYTMYVQGIFLPNRGTVRFSGSVSQPTDNFGPSRFHNVTVQNTAADPGPSSSVTIGAPVDGTLLVLDGMVTTFAGARVHNVIIAADGILNQSAPGFAVSGDFTLEEGGTFLANSHPVTFDGDDLQTVSGSPMFDTLNIANRGVESADRGTSGSVVTLDPISVAAGLTVTEGRFAPGAPASFGNTFVGPGAILDPLDSVVLTFSGDLVNSGTLVSAANEIRFEGTGVQMLGSDSAAEFGSLHIGASSILHEVGDADNFTNNGATTNDGVLRRTRSVTGPGVVTGGLTGASLNFAETGTVSTVVIDRFGSVPNATPDHTEPVSWTFDVGAGVAYDAAVTLSHALDIPSRATVSRYLGTGTDWDYLRNTFTTTTVTRTGVTDLSSRWAVADRANASIENGFILY